MTEYSEAIPSKAGHYVYRLWGADGTCLYVGLVGERRPLRVRDRLRSHKHGKPWWPQVARIDVAAFPDAAAIIAEEKEQIRQLHPVHNRALLDRCSKGHLIGPRGRYSNHKCRECHRLEERTPARKASHARWKRKAARRPAPGQQPLF